MLLNTAGVGSESLFFGGLCGSARMACSESNSDLMKASSVKWHDDSACGCRTKAALPKSEVLFHMMSVRVRFILVAL